MGGDTGTTLSAEPKPTKKKTRLGGQKITNKPGEFRI
jgi:hypothetical protein